MNRESDHHGTSHEARWRRHGLRVLFTLSMIWATLLGFSQELFAWTTDRPNASALEWLIVIAVCLVAVGVTCGAYAAWPGFLRIPGGTGLAAVFVRLLLIGVVVFVLAGMGFAVIEYLRLRLTGDPSNPQYGLSLVIAAIWYPTVVTPAVAVPLAWLAIRSRSTRSHSC